MHSWRSKKKFFFPMKHVITFIHKFHSIFTFCESMEEKNNENDQKKKGWNFKISEILHSLQKYWLFRVCMICWTLLRQVFGVKLELLGVKLKFQLFFSIKEALTNTVGFWISVLRSLSFLSLNYSFTKCKLEGLKIFSFSRKTRIKDSPDVPGQNFLSPFWSSIWLKSLHLLPRYNNNAMISDKNLFWRGISLFSFISLLSLVI